MSLASATRFRSLTDQLTPSEKESWLQNMVHTQSDLLVTSLFEYFRPTELYNPQKKKP